MSTFSPTASPMCDRSKTLHAPAQDTLTVYAFTTILMAATGGLLFGYDIGVIGGCLTLPGFRDAMGWPPSTLAADENGPTCGPDRPAEDMQVSIQIGWITR